MPFYFLVLPQTSFLLTPFPHLLRWPFFGAVTRTCRTSMTECGTLSLTPPAISVTSSCSQQLYSHPELVSIFPSEQLIKYYHRLWIFWPIITFPSLSIFSLPNHSVWRFTQRNQWINNASSWTTLRMVWRNKIRNY